MHKRTAYTKYIPKIRNSVLIPELETNSGKTTVEKMTKFELPTDDNCCTFVSIPIDKLHFKTKVKIPPIVHQLQQGKLEHLMTLETSSDKKIKDRMTT